ncbi:MAG: PKD domain-containing protein [Bacteroidales bacterium]|nr:PKD domain-containing protein [Bacteroidales bacterium]
MKRIILLVLTLLSITSLQVTASGLTNTAPQAMPDSTFFDCTADFYYTNQDTTVWFTNASWSSLPITSFYWEFGDGTTSTDANPTHNYPVLGIYYVTLTITTANCTSSMTLEVWLDYIFPVDCQADFYYWPMGLNVMFYDGSYSYTPVTSWYWNFGDGDTSTLQEPIHNYDSVGVYEVSLTITSDSCTSTAIYYVYLDSVSFPECYASFGYDIDPANSYDFDFYDFSYALAPITSWIWNFGDGTTSTLQNPSHLFTQQGIYEVSLTITSDSCTNTYAEWITVGNSSSGDCQADFWYYTYSSYSVEFFDLSWSNSPILTWTWDFGDGTTSNLPYPMHQYSAPGVYPVSLTIQSDSCTSTVFYPIYVDSIIVPDCYADGNYYSNGLTVVFQDYSYAMNPINSWYWEFGDGTTSTQQNPTHVYPTAGYYDVMLTITSDSCTSSMYLGVFVDSIIYYECMAEFYTTPNPSDPLSILYVDNSYAMNQITSWFWEFGDGGTSTDQYPYHTYAAAGTYSVTLSIMAIPWTYPGDTCFSTTTYSIVVGNSNPGNCIAMFNYSVSNQTTVDFSDQSYSATPIQYWYWDFGDGSTSTLQNPTHTYAAPGFYVVNLYIEADSCSSYSSNYISLTTGNGNALPGGGPLWEMPACQAFFLTIADGLEVEFTNLSVIPLSGVVMFNWDFGDGNSSSDFSPTHTYASDGVYNVILTLSSGASCGGTYEVQLYINSASNWGSNCQAAFFPVTDTMVNTIQFIDMSVFDVINPTTFSWNFGDGSFSYDMNPLHTYAQAGTYTVYHEIASGTCISGMAIEVDLQNNSFMPMPGYTPLAIDEEDELGTISLYPNPATDKVYLSTEMIAAGRYDISMYDITGKLLVAQSLQLGTGEHTTELLVDMLAKGSYFVRITGTNASKTLQFVK